MRLPRTVAQLILLCGTVVAQNEPSKPVGNAPSQPKPETYRISGVVVSAVDNQPLADVEVTIAATEERADTREVVTGSDGRFVFQNVSPGKYSLTGMRRGFSVQAYQQHDQYSTAIAVGPNLVSEGLLFQLTPDASIAGNVLDEENEPVRSGEAMLFSRSGDSGGIRLVVRNGLDQQGHFRFSHLKAGTYYVAITAQPWYAQDPQESPGVREPLGRVEAFGSSVETESVEKSDTAVSALGDASKWSQTTVRGMDPAALDVVYPVTYYPNATDAESAEPIQLHAGEHASADVTLHAVPAISLRVINGTTDPSMPMTTVIEQRIFDFPLPVASRNQVASKGTVTVTGVPPGHLVLSVRHFTGKEWVSLNKEINASSNAEIDASENSAGPLVIKGRLHRPGGVAFPPGTYVRFSRRETEEAFGAQVNEQGEFDLEQGITGSAGYNVVVFNVHGLLVNNLTATGARVVGHTIFFPRTGPVQVNIALSGGSGRVDGTVMQEGKPASETMVLLVPQHPSEEATLFRRDQSDSDGTFTLREILPGRYTVVAIERGWELNWRDPGVLKPYLEHGQVVDIGANKTYKISLNLQSKAAPATSASSTVQ